MRKIDPYIVALVVIGLAAVVIPITAAFIQPDCTTTLYTEDWPEARQFARECEDTGGTVTMRPHWRSQADRPYAATIICSR